MNQSKHGQEKLRLPFGVKFLFACTIALISTTIIPGCKYLLDSVKVDAGGVEYKREGRNVDIKVDDRRDK